MKPDLPKYVQDMHIKNYTAMLIDIKEDQTKQREKPCSLVETEYS